jgi:hypothetical protein
MFRLALVAGVLAVLLITFKDSIWSAIAEHRIRSETGMEVRIGKFSSGLFSQTVTIQDLKLYNTPEFGGTLFLDIPELHVELDPIALAQRRLRFKLIRFNLAEIAIVTNEAGKTNIMAFLDQSKTNRSRKHPGNLNRVLGDLEFDGIEVLNLSLGQAKFLDLGAPGTTREVRVDMQNQIFKRVNSEGDAYAILFMIWLRSGGKLSLSPNDVARDYFDRKVNQIETKVREAVAHPLPTAPK